MFSSLQVKNIYCILKNTQLDKTYKQKDKMFTVCPS